MRQQLQKIMEHSNDESWIWLSNDRYPEYQNTFLSLFSDKEGFKYCVADFKKSYSFSSIITKAVLRVSGDTNFRLKLNGSYVGEGPVKESRDFFDSDSFINRFSNLYTLYPNSNTLDFFAQVQMSPIAMNDSSRGHGGFMLSGLLYDEHGNEFNIQTDETWLSRVNRQEPFASDFDATCKHDEWSNSSSTSNIWNTVDAPIPMLHTEKILPSSNHTIEVLPQTTSTVDVFFDKIYSAHVAFDIECGGVCEMNFTCYEKEPTRSTNEHAKTVGNMSYEGFTLHSIGAYKLEVTNHSDSVATIHPYAVFVCYPVTDEGYFKCNDNEMNKVFDVCKWTTQICRQTMHLDSPTHQEPLACTGDYYIESLITAMCFGDMRLAELDVLRTAQMLEHSGGKMFHTTYSLIWVQMLYDTYMFTANKKLLFDCAEALHVLLNRFNGYLGENEIIDNPPDYMFADWVVVDGYSLHHPPKALGQTVLNAFYYGALITASKICAITGDCEHEKLYLNRADSLKNAVNTLLFDKEKGIYFDGLSTPNTASTWLPENSSTRYYTRHSNSLAVLYGLCDEKTGTSIMEKVVNDEWIVGVQPYFMHFVLCALRKVGLFEKYGFTLLEKWKPSVMAFGKGLQEGWLKPEEGYPFDYSHAWGGTPAYQLIIQLLGLEMVEPGYKKIKLDPKLYNYSYAYISIPTPYGYITCSMKQGEPVFLSVPQQIIVV